jgi:uncharacterized YigZ family protein
MMRSDQDYYFTIETAYRAPELKVKGSRFIADLFPAGSKQEIEEYLDRIRREFYDATHHCYAYRFGIQGETIRAADDGEPSGTAGKPILLALSSKEVTDALLVVTRYYGGTNLGTGGLSRAYGEAAGLAVTGAVIKTVYLTDTFTVSLHYEEVAAFERLCIAYQTKIRDAEYGESIHLKVDIRKSLSEKFKTDILDKFYGKILLAEER